MATEKWIAGSGAGFTWTDAFTSSTLNSIASGNAILSGTAISNQTALDMFCDVSWNGASITVAAPAFIGVYIYPLDSDGSTYGDGRFGSSAAGPPPSQYFVGAIGVPTGTAAQYGQLTGILIPPGTFKFVLHNQLGATLASSGNTFEYRTYNRSVA